MHGGSIYWDGQHWGKNSFEEYNQNTVRNVHLASRGDAEDITGYESLWLGEIKAGDKLLDPKFCICHLRS